MAKIDLQGLIDSVLSMAKDSEEERKKKAYSDWTTQNSLLSTRAFQEQQGTTPEMNLERLKGANTLANTNASEAGALARQGLANAGGKDVAGINFEAKKYDTDVGATTARAELGEKVRQFDSMPKNSAAAGQIVTEYLKNNPQDFAGAQTLFSSLTSGAAAPDGSDKTEFNKQKKGSPATASAPASEGAPGATKKRMGFFESISKFMPSFSATEATGETLQTKIMPPPAPETQEQWKARNTSAMGNIPFFAGASPNDQVLAKRYNENLAKEAVARLDPDAQKKRSKAAGYY